MSTVVKTNICNMALSFIGVAKTITNIDTEKSTEAAQCRLFFDLMFKECLQECRYSESKVQRALTLIDDVPNRHWRYAYSYPSDALFITRLFRSSAYSLGHNSSYRHLETLDGLGDLQWEKGFHDGQVVIFTDQEQAVAEFTSEVGLGVEFSSKLYLGAAYRLAYYIAPTVARGKGEKLQPMLEKKARIKLGEAQALNHNEQQFSDTDTNSQLENSRMGY